jgi:hypothetical protein
VYSEDYTPSACKDLRGCVRPFPSAKIALEKVEGRLRFVLRVIETWDDSHAKQAKELICLGCLPAANTAASLIFDADLRRSLLAQTPISGDAGAAERIAEATALGREMLS